MPVYEYECGRCALRFELKKNFSEDGSSFCAQCGGEAHRLFSPVPIIFKGSGFYVTDRQKDHHRPSEKEKADKTDTDKKSESKELGKGC